jgi:hypothetical protein
MISTEVEVTLISTCGLVVVALIGVLVELVRARRRQDQVVREVTPNGGSSLHDGIRRIEDEIREIRRTTYRHGERLASLESGNARYSIRSEPD